MWISILQICENMSCKQAISLQLLTDTMKNPVYRLIIPILLLLSLHACKEPLVEVQEDFHSVEDNIKAEVQCYATFDVVSDLISTEKLYTNEGSTLLPFGSTLSFIDSSYDDGDGIEVFLDFGELGSQAPHGILCPDGLYRSGRLRVSIEGNFLAREKTILVDFPESSGFHTGDGEQMTAFVGSMKIMQKGLGKHNVKVDQIEVKDASGNLTWSCDHLIEVTHDAGEGQYGDTYEVSGTSTGTNRNGVAYSCSIDANLEKTLEKGCAETFKRGQLSISETERSKNMRVDYDPYGDGACDNAILVDINGKRTILEID